MALEGFISQAYPAQMELPIIGSGPTADLATVVLPDCKFLRP
jgi:hypothetical protein